MSRQNKVNPTYRQAGRLSPDDAARELKKQREAASPQDVNAPRVTEKDKNDEEDEPEDSSEE